MKKLSKICVLVAIVLLITTFLVAGCSEKMSKEEKSIRKENLNAIKNVSDLAFIKVNNYMAKWENPGFNLNYKGSNVLKVAVPHTNLLSITDIETSKGSEVKVYLDKEYKNEQINIKEIKIEKALTLYMQVQNLYNAEQRTNYEVKVSVDVPKYKTESFTPNLNNPNGHIMLPEDLQEVEIDGLIYTIVRTTTDFLNMDKDFAKNYILANNISFSKGTFKPFNIIGGKPYIAEIKGIIDGNNFSLSYNEDNSNYIFPGVEKTGVIKNLIVNSDANSLYLVSLLGESLGKIINVVNKINISGWTSGITEGMKEHNIYTDKDIIVIEDSVNYGNFTSKSVGSGISGIIKYGGASYCYNVGDLVGDIAIGGISNTGQFKYESCANLGDIYGVEKIGGISSFASGEYHIRKGETIYGKREFCYNYGEIIDVKDWENSYSEKEFTDIGGIVGHNKGQVIENCKSIFKPSRNKLIISFN